MITPPLIIASAVLFWGIESGNLVIGLILGLLIGGVTLVTEKWRLSDKDCVSVSDLTSVIFLTAATLIFLHVEMVIFLKTIIIWLPLILLPLIIAQLYSGREKIIIGTRLGLNRTKSYKRTPLDFRIYYLALCLLSTAMANSRSQLFFPCAGALFFWLLFVNRGKGFSLLTFVMVFMMAAGCGYTALKGAEIAHDYISQKTRKLVRGYFRSLHADPFQSHLSFGAIGRLKTSGKIVLRLKTEGKAPLLLKQGSYESFNRQIWHSNLVYQPLISQHFIWNLLPEPHVPAQKATIEFYLPKEKGLLPHPKGSYQLNGPMIFEMEQKSDGITRVTDGAPLITYELFYNSALERETDVPSRRNLALHPEEEHILAKIVDNWHVENASDKEKVSKIRHFFVDGFTYSLTLRGKGSYSSPLEHFLQGSRDGYCELFATATTLLLRKVGVPSRYVTGFTVTEKSRFENKYIVRERHAHAWSEAYVDGVWMVVDTTPPNWFDIDNMNRSSFEKVRDFLQFLRLKYDVFSMQTDQNYRLLLSLVVVALSIILLYRIYRRMDTTTIDVEYVQETKTFSPAESPLYEIEQRLVHIGGARHKDESFLLWAKRINGPKNIDLATIEHLFHLHQKLRFDPTGLEGYEQKQLDELAHRWLETYCVSEEVQHNPKTI